MTIVPPLGPKALVAMKFLAKVPPDLIRALGEALEPVISGLGDVVRSVGGVFDKAGDRLFVQEHQRQMLALQQRHANQEMILKAAIAQELLKFTAREQRSCLAFIRWEIREVEKSYREQLVFFNMWWKDLEKRLVDHMKTGNLEDEKEASKVLIEEFKKDKAVIRDLIKLESRIYTDMKKTLLGTLVEAHALQHVTLKELKGIRNDRLLKG